MTITIDQFFQMISTLQKNILFIYYYYKLKFTYGMHYRINLVYCSNAFIIIRYIILCTCSHHCQRSGACCFPIKIRSREIFFLLFFLMLKIVCFIVFPTVFPSNNGHLEFQTRAMINVLVFAGTHSHTQTYMSTHTNIIYTYKYII